MSDAYVYTTEDAALEAMYAMPTGAIVCHEFTMYMKVDGNENRWVTALDTRDITAEEIVSLGLPLERLDLDPEMASTIEDEKYHREAVAAAAEEDRL